MRASWLILVGLLAACTLLVTDAVVVSRKHHRGHHKARLNPVALKFQFNPPRAGAKAEKLCQDNVSDAQFESAIRAAYNDHIVPNLEHIVAAAQPAGKCAAEINKWFGPKHDKLARQVLQRTVNRLTHAGPATKAITIHRWMYPKDIRPEACQSTGNIMYTAPRTSNITVCTSSYDVPSIDQMIVGKAPLTCTGLRPKWFLAFALFHEFTHAAAGTSDRGYKEDQALAEIAKAPKQSAEELEAEAKATRQGFFVQGNEGASDNAQNYAFWFRDCFMKEVAGVTWGAATGDNAAGPAAAAADAAPTAAGPTTAPTAQAPAV